MRPQAVSVRLLLLCIFSIVSDCAARSYVLLCLVPGARRSRVLSYSLNRAPYEQYTCTLILYSGEVQTIDKLDFCCLFWDFFFCLAYKGEMCLYFWVHYLSISTLQFFFSSLLYCRMVKQKLQPMMLVIEQHQQLSRSVKMKRYANYCFICIFPTFTFNLKNTFCNSVYHLHDFLLLFYTESVPQKYFCSFA